ncbi:MAG: NAD(+)/NADH kinase [Ruminiclostridium sp.]|nr:NAD(+)/NADH kinase [Ruminiclostridium sp.]
MNIYICPCVEKEKSMALLPSVIDALDRYGITAVMSDDVRKLFDDKRVIYSDSIVNNRSIIKELDDCDMIMTVGGDGMMLKMGKAAAVYNKPLIGINTGRLGFMTALNSDELEKLSALSYGTYTMSRRMLLDMTEEGSGESGNNGSFVYQHYALNDFVLFKDVNSKLPEFTIRANGETVTKIRADGLIFSTPTGSTAYALSAGGPIIEPTIECIQMTPLCPHSLMNRPMIFSGSDKITASYTAYEGSRVNISADGGESREFRPDKEITIFKSDLQLNIVQIGGKSFYRTVSEKLMTTLK